MAPGMLKIILPSFKMSKIPFVRHRAQTKLATCTPPKEKKEDCVEDLAEVHGDSIPDLHLRPWDFLSKSAAQYPSREAIVSMWQTTGTDHSVVACSDPPSSSQCLRWTYHDLMVQVQRLAKSLKNLGCEPGMQIAVVLWNSAEWGLCFWTAAKMGLTFVPIDSRAAADTSSMLLSISPHVIVVQDAEGAALVDRLTGKLKTPLARIQCIGQVVKGWISLSVLLSGGGSVDSLTTGSDIAKVSSRELSISQSEAALIVFTSGTTGKPKGCIYTNDVLVSQTWEYDPNPEDAPIDRWLIHTPITHIFALNNALRAWRTGSAVVFPSKSFNVDSTLRGLTDERCTIMSVTPTLVKALLAHPTFPGAGRLNLSFVSLSGTTITETDISLCRSALGAKNVIQAYGMTEGAPIASWTRRDPMLAGGGYYPGIGKVLPGAAIRICHPGSRQVLLRGVVGELHIGGSTLISGYVDKTDQSSFYKDHAGRWFVTGDQAKIDHHGILHLLGRYNDLIIRGGENIQPSSIESVLSQLSGLQVSHSHSSRSSLAADKNQY